MAKETLVAKKMSAKEQAEFDQGYQDRRSADKSFSVLNPYYLSDKIENLTGSGSAMRKVWFQCFCLGRSNGRTSCCY